MYKLINGLNNKLVLLLHRGNFKNVDFFQATGFSNSVVKSTRHIKKLTIIATKTVQFMRSCHTYSHISTSITLKCGYLTWSEHKQKPLFNKC